jgi:hypothetical protein
MCFNLKIERDVLLCFDSNCQLMCDCKLRLFMKYLNRIYLNCCACNIFILNSSRYTSVPPYFIYSLRFIIF